MPSPTQKCVITHRIPPSLLTVALFLGLITAFIFQGIFPLTAFAGTNTYPTSISGCSWVPGGQPAGTCDLRDSTQDTYFDPWKEENRECTSYAAWMLSSVNGFTMPFNDNAVNWGTKASGLGYAVNSTPALGSIYWSSPSDHVAYVENISTDGSQVQLEDYNAGYPNNPGQWAEYWASTSSATDYIHFKDLSSGLGGGNASSWTSGRFDAWIEQASATNGSNLGHIWFNGAWQPWETIGATNNELMASQPAAVSWGLNRIDVFAQGQAGDLIHAWFDGTKWYPWESLGGCVEGSPTVTSWGPGRLDVFVEGCNPTGGNLWHTWYDSSGWHAFENIATNMVMTASPSAVAWGPNRIDIFSRGTDSSLIHTFFDGSWNNWESLGGCIVGSPAASSWVSGRVDAWVEGCNTTGGNFYQTWWSAPTGWSAFNQLSSTYQISGVLGAVSWGPNRIDMFTRASNNTLDHWWFDGTSFQGPENKGGSIAP